MPTAKKPTKSGGVSGSEEPVSTKSAPSPKKTESGNTSATRTKKAQPKDETYPATAKDASRGPDDHTEATGRDHPSQSEVAKALFEKLHGTSDQRINPPAGGPPKPGFNPKGGFNVKNQVKGGSGPRRTQGKGG